MRRVVLDGAASGSVMAPGIVRSFLGAEVSVNSGRWFRGDVGDSTSVSVRAEAIEIAVPVGPDAWINREASVDQPVQRRSGASQKCAGEGLPKSAYFELDLFVFGR